MIGAERGAEFDNALLGPEALTSGVFRNEAAMAAVLGRNKLDGRILVDSGGQERTEGHEGIVLGGDQEQGHADLRRDAFRTHVLVIVLSVVIAELRRGDDVIESTDRPDWSQAGNRVALRKHFVFSLIARHQAIHEAPLVNIVVHAFERVGASRKVEGRTHRADTAQRLWYSGAKLSGHLGHEISAHRVAGEKDLFETVNI